MGNYKRTDIHEDAVYDGYSYFDGDGDEITLETPTDTDVAKYVWLGYDGESAFTLVWRDIPKMIVMLEEAYKYCKENADG